MVIALAASWVADGLGGDGLHTDLNQAVGRNLAWGIVPAALGILSVFVPTAQAFFPLFVVLWMVVSSTALVFRYRRARTSSGTRMMQSGAWLLGTGLTTAAVVFVAGLFDLTGA